MTLTFEATVRRVWPAKAPGKPFTVILERHGGDYRQIVTWTVDQWVASLCDRVSGPVTRPLMTIEYDPQSKRLLRVGPVADPVEAR